MPDHDKDIQELIGFLAVAKVQPYTYPATQHAEIYHAALTALVAERDALRTKEDSWKSAQKAALADIDKADAERVAELEAQSPATSDLRERDEAMTLWMDQVTAMLCHSMTHSHDAKQTLMTRCDTAIAAMRKGGGA